MAEAADASEAGSELECGICCMPYDCYDRAPRRLGGARGSWKPSRCRHVICNACVCKLARECWWEQVVCPYCRTVTSLRKRSTLLVGGVRFGGWRRRLVMPPIDSELWQRLVLQKRELEQSDCVLRLTEDDDDNDEEEEEEEQQQENSKVVQRRPWWTLKKKKGGGGGQAHARGGRGQGRGSSGSTWRRQQPINCLKMKDLALVTCYVV